MHKTFITALVAASVLAGVAAPAFAAGNDGSGRHGPRAERLLETFDADGNGAISQAEIAAHRAATFESVDADGNGALSQEEFGMLKQIREARREQARAAAAENGDASRQMGQGKGMGRKGDRRGPSFADLDADKNGSVSLAEFTANTEKMFARLDRNSDGEITAADFPGKVRNSN